MAQCMNISECPDSLLSLAPAYHENYAAASPSISEFEPVLSSRTWAFKLAVISLISIVCLSKQVQARRASKALSSFTECKDPPQVPYLFPVLGNVLSYLMNPFGLASSIRCVESFSSSSIRHNTSGPKTKRHADRTLALLRWFASTFSPRIFTS